MISKNDKEKEDKLPLSGVKQVITIHPADTKRVIKGTLQTTLYKPQSANLVK